MPPPRPPRSVIRRSVTVAVVGRNTRRDLALVTSTCRDQEFRIPFRALDRALDDAEDRPTGESAEPAGDALAHLPVPFGIAHHAALSHPRAADLELRLDEGKQPRAGTCQREGGRKHCLE